MNSQYRQIRDIQVQADRICTRKVSYNEVVAFAKYSRELKAFLATNLKDDMLLGLVGEIPDLESALQKKNIGYGALEGVLAVFGGVLPIFSREIRKVNQAKSIVKEIQGKYASIGFILGNQS